MIVKIHQCYSKNPFPFNIFAIAIRKFSKTNYSHYALSYTSGNGDRVYCDSTGWGVARKTEEDYLKHYLIIKEFTCEKHISVIDFLAWFELHEGKSYGFMQIIGIMLKILKMVKHNPFGAGAKRIICNELIVLFLNRFYDASIKDTDSIGLTETEKLIGRLL